EVAVQRADGDVGSFGDGTHLNGLVTALRGDGQGGVQDALAALTLGFGPEFGLCQYGHVHHLARPRFRPRTRVWGCWHRGPRHAVGCSFIYAYPLKTIRMPGSIFFYQRRDGTDVSCCNGGRLDGRSLALLEHVLVGS